MSDFLASSVSPGQPVTGGTSPGLAPQPRPVAPQQQQQQGGGNPLTMGMMLSNIMGMGGAGIGGGPAALASTGGAQGVAGGSMGPVAGLAASESAAGIGGAGGAGGAGMSGLAMTGWGTLLAAIIGNETMASKGGFRSSNPMQYGADLLSGHVMGQDVSQRWLPGIGIGEDSTANKAITSAVDPFTLLGKIV